MPGSSSATDPGPDVRARVLAGYAAHNRWASEPTPDNLSAILDGLHPEVVWEEWPQMPDASVYHGRDAVRRYLETMSESFDEVTQTPEEVSAVGADVLVHVHQRARVRGGPEVEQRVVHVWTLDEDGLARRLRVFRDRDEALAALGA